MPSRDLHDKPYSEGTKTKLRIYRSYVQAWLQVFLHAEAFRSKPFQFYDFFAGPGEDAHHEPGSPLILIDELLQQRGPLHQRGHEIRILFNDSERAKTQNLRRLCDERRLPWSPRFESLEFAAAFRKYRNEFGQSPSLVFVDQNGLKHVTRQVFEVLSGAPLTDLLFFTASSFKHRFGDLLAPEITLPSEISYLDVHRALADVYRQWAPPDFFVGHFSIKKDSNIYGLIFGSHHWRGMQKFLEIVWKLDASCGEANYELEQGTSQGEMDFDLGTAVFKKRKVEVFQDALSQKVTSGSLKMDADVFLHCLTNGFLPRVAKDVYDNLRNSGVLRNPRAALPRYSTESMKTPRKLEL